MSSGGQWRRFCENEAALFTETQQVKSRQVDQARQASCCCWLVYPTANCRWDALANCFSVGLSRRLTLVPLTSVVLEQGLNKGSVVVVPRSPPRHPWIPGVERL
jgi:hypothetical protein